MQNIKISPETVFIFDLHGVIFRLDPFQILKEIIRCPFKFKLFKTLLYPKIILNTYLSLKKGAIAEEVLLKLETDFPQFEKLVSTGFQIINAQKPITPTINVIRNLKKHNYKIYIFSNIGQNSMNILQDKFPDIFVYFNGVLCSSSKDNYLKKPNVQAFSKCLDYFNLNKSNIIFIDDKITNIETAKNLGFHTILFKSGQDLNEKLRAIKLFI